MPVVKNKYRGKPMYHLVYAELITAARYRGTVTYQEVALVMGLPLTGSHMGKETGHLIGEISEDEHGAGRPMLSALVVGVNGFPGDGFFTFAAQLGKQVGANDDEKAAFWEAEKVALYEIWKRPLYKPNELDA